MTDESESIKPSIDSAYLSTLGAEVANMLEAHAGARVEFMMVVTIPGHDCGQTISNMHPAKMLGLLLDASSSALAACLVAAEAGDTDMETYAVRHGPVQ